MKFISEKISIGDEEWILRIPNPVETEQAYQRAKEENPNEPFPFWTRLWPSAIALSAFILENRNLVEHKKVLEMGAGLGLPSIVSSRFAECVIWSDYLPQAQAWMRENILLQGITNIQCRLLDFTNVSDEADADILLLSDISYDPKLFPHVSKLLHRFFKKKRTILLSTPQRLTAAGFIEQIQSHIAHREDRTILYDGKKTEISLFVLKESQ